MRSLILSSAIDPDPNSRRVRVQGLSGQFRMILICKRAQATSSKQQALDKSSWIWDNMITINKRITHANELQRQLRNVTKATQSFGSEAQGATRQHQLVSSGAARAGRPVRRGAGMHHQLARSAKLRHLHAADPVPDGREASSGGWRNGRYHSDQGAKVHRSQKEVQDSGLINRGLRAPAIWDQGSSYKLQAASCKQQVLQLRYRFKRQATSCKLQAASSKLQGPSTCIKYRAALLVGLD